MPWKIGGNYESVLVMCEINWRECATAVVNYLWSELVTDVLDSLVFEGIIWILAISIATMILLYLKYRKNVHAESVIFDKCSLNQIGYKIQDLELKFNVLTYKMQYGTWPIPSQIYDLNLKKLHKTRMALSNTSDPNNWIKRILLSTYSSRKNICCQNVSTEECDTSINENVSLQKQGMKHLPFDLYKISFQSSKTLLAQNKKPVETNVTHNSKQESSLTITQSSQQNLHEIKKELINLYNMLQKYESENWFMKKQNSINQNFQMQIIPISKINTLNKTVIDKAEKYKTNKNYNIESKENSHEIQCSYMNNSPYFGSDESEENLSSLILHSPNISKTKYQCSNDIMPQIIYFNSCKRNNAKQMSALIDSSPSFITIKSDDNKMPSLYVPEYYENKFDMSKYVYDILNDKHKLRNFKENELETALKISYVSLESLGNAFEYETQNQNNTFFSTVLNVIKEEPTTSNFHEKINQHCICTEKKLQYIYSPPLQKMNTFIRRKSEGDIKNNNFIYETPSEYFTINDMIIYNNNRITNDLNLLESPQHEDLIFTTTSTDIKNYIKINTDVKTVQTRNALKNNQTTKLNLKENITCAGDIKCNAVHKHIENMHALKDLVSKPVKTVKDYKCIILQSQNNAILKARKMLRYQDTSGTFQCPNEKKYIVLHDRLITSFSCNNINADYVPKKLRPKFLNTLPNFKCKTCVRNDFVKYYPESDLRTNSEIYTLIIPNKNKCSNNNDIAIEKERTDLSSLLNLKHSCEIVPKTDLLSQIKYYSIMPYQPVNQYLKRSQLFLSHCNHLAHVHKIHQSCANLHSDKNKRLTNEKKLVATIKLKSNASLQKMSVKSYIPILKRRLEAVNQIKYRTCINNLTRNPSTMSRKKKIGTNNYTQNKKRTRKIGILNKEQLHINDLTSPKPNTESNMFANKIEHIFTTYSNNNITLKENQLNDKKIKLLGINEQYPYKRFIYGKKRLQTTVVEEIEKEAAAKPSIIDTCTSTSDLY